jgi:hypothetical protein
LIRFLRTLSIFSNIAAPRRMVTAVGQYIINIQGINIDKIIAWLETNKNDKNVTISFFFFKSFTFVDQIQKKSTQFFLVNKYVDFELTKVKKSQRTFF